MNEARPSLRDPAILAATWFGAGYLPKAPGTWGSLAALPFAWIIASAGGWPALLIASVLIFALGCWASQRAVEKSGAGDPQFIVIDEVAGQWIVLLAAPLNPVFYLVGFLAFRLFDIWKPWPVRWADRTIKGGIGVMLDDVLAGAYGLIVVLVVRQIWG